MESVQIAKSEMRLRCLSLFSICVSSMNSRWSRSSDSKQRARYLENVCNNFFFSSGPYDAFFFKSSFSGCTAVNDLQMHVKMSKCLVHVSGESMCSLWNEIAIACSFFFLAKKKNNKMLDVTVFGTVIFPLQFFAIPCNTQARLVLPSHPVSRTKCPCISSINRN